MAHDLQKINPISYWSNYLTEWDYSETFASNWQLELFNSSVVCRYSFSANKCSCLGMAALLSSLHAVFLLCYRHPFWWTSMLIYSLDIFRGSREEELPSIFNCMKTAIQLSKVTTLGFGLLCWSYIILFSIVFKCNLIWGWDYAVLISRMLLRWWLVAGLSPSLAWSKPWPVLAWAGAVWTPVVWLLC